VYARGDWSCNWKGNADQESQEGSDSNGRADEYWVGEIKDLSKGWAQVVCIWAESLRLALSTVMRAKVKKG